MCIAETEITLVKSRAKHASEGLESLLISYKVAFPGLFSIF